MNLACYIHYFVRVEIKANNSIVALRIRRFFFDAKAVAFLVEFSYTIAFRVGNPITENGGFAIFCICNCIIQECSETTSIEDIIAQYQASGIITYEILTDGEGLSESIG